MITTTRHGYKVMDILQLIGSRTRTSIWMAWDYSGARRRSRLPSRTIRWSTTEALGNMGQTAEFWAGVEKLEAKIKWASFILEVLSAAGSPFQAPTRFRCGEALNQYTSQGLNWRISGCLPDDRRVQGRRKSHFSSQHENVDSTSSNHGVSLRALYLSRVQCICMTSWPISTL